MKSEKNLHLNKKEDNGWIHTQSGTNREMYVYKCNEVHSATATAKMHLIPLQPCVVAVSNVVETEWTSEEGVLATERLQASY